MISPTPPPAASTPSSDAPQPPQWIVVATTLFSNGSETRRMIVGWFGFETREQARKFRQQWRHPYMTLMAPRRPPRSV